MAEEQDIFSIPILRLVADREFSLITKEHVEELFNILDDSKSGYIQGEDLILYAEAGGSAFDPDVARGIIRDCDKNLDDMLSLEEFTAGFMNGDTGVREYVSKVRGIKKTGGELSRDNFLVYLNHQFAKDDACWSLPNTILLFAIYLVLIQVHGSTSDQFWIHHALEGEVSDEGGRSNHEGPFLVRDVHDVPTWWDWAITSLTAASLKHDLKLYSQPGRMGSHNQMIGGLQLRRIKTNNEACEQDDWLIDVYRSDDSGLSCQPADVASHTENVWLLYHEDKETISSRLRKMQQDVWINNQVTRVEIRGLFLNGQYKFFTVMILGFDFQRDGFLKIRFDWQSVSSNPYSNLSVYFVDALFMLMVLKMAYNETKELIPAIRNGWDGFIDYVGFWNFIDWLSIFVAFAQFGVWLAIVWIVSHGLMKIVVSLTPTFDRLDARIRDDQQFLSSDVLDSLVGGRDSYQAQLDIVQEYAYSIFTTQATYQSLTAVYTGVIIFRFFKAFRANPRLSIVTDTIAQGAVDLTHFFIVFLVFYVAFAVIASVIFGPRMKSFSSYRRSIIMCWRILMGEFDVDEMIEVNEFWGSVWFFMFEALVLLVLLNMLLAIVMDTYSMVKGEQKETLTIWAQAIDTYHQIQDTKGFVSLWVLICDFEDDDNPAHPEKTVSTKSLRKAFPRMSKRNSEYLVKKAQEYWRVQGNHDSIMLSDAIRAISRIERRQHDMAGCVVLINERLMRIMDRPSVERTAEEAPAHMDDHLAASEPSPEPPTIERLSLRSSTVHPSDAQKEGPFRPSTAHPASKAQREESFRPATAHPASNAQREESFRPSTAHPASKARRQESFRPATAHPASKVPKDESDPLMRALHRGTSNINPNPNRVFTEDGIHVDGTASLERLVKFMEPEGLLDDRFKALGQRTERLASLCEQTLHNNIEQCEVLDRLDRLEDNMRVMRRDNASNIKDAKDTQTIKKRLEELVDALSGPRADRDDMMWRVGMDVKDVKKYLENVKMSQAVLIDEVQMLQQRSDAHYQEQKAQSPSAENRLLAPPSRATRRTRKVSPADP